MENNHKIPTRLIERFLHGKISDSEEKELLGWIDKTPNSYVIFQNEQERLRPLIAKQKDEEVNIQWKKLIHKMHEIPAMGHSRIRRLLFPSVAAILLIALVITSIVINREPKQLLAENNTEVVTPCGQKTKLVLPDGTRVIINSGSKLVYPEEFKNDIRKVELYGEAYFEVTPNKDKPFIVKTYGLNVRVLGTAFNLEAFPDAGEINTTLVHGKVLLETEANDKITPVTEMAPYEHAVFKTDKQEISIQKESNIDKYIAWKDGKLVFMNASVEEVAQKLELWFNVSVQIKSEELKAAHFTGTFTNESIDQVLKLLKISYPIEYEIIKVESSELLNSPEFDIVLSSSE